MIFGNVEHADGVETGLGSPVVGLSSDQRVVALRVSVGVHVNHVPKQRICH